MRHLSPDQLIDLIEGTAPEPLRRHAQACERCRADAEALRAVVAEASADEMPEPSPLFWDHLSARVSEAIRREPAGPPWWRRGWWRLVPVFTASAIVLAAVLGVSWWGPREPPMSRPAATSGELASAPVQDTAPDGDEETPWTLMSRLASDVSAEDVVASAFSPGPGSLDLAPEQLAESERVELVRLLKAELARGER